MNPWNFFKYKYVVSLKDRNDRRKHIQTELEKFSVYQDFTIFDAIKGSDSFYLRQYLTNQKILLYTTSLNDGELGCLYSHYLIWLKSYLNMKSENDHFWILVLEDDACFHPNFTNDVFRSILEKIPNNAKYLQFGYLAAGPYKKSLEYENEKWKKLVGKTFSTIAYAVHTSYLPYLLNYCFSGPVDHLNHLEGVAFAVTDCLSDNQNNSNNNFFKRQAIYHSSGIYYLFEEYYGGIIGAKENGLDSDTNLAYQNFLRDNVIIVNDNGVLKFQSSNSVMSRFRIKSV